MTHPRTRLYRHPDFTGHDVTPHPESPERIRAIDTELERRALLADRLRPHWSPASDDMILRAHDRPLLDRLERLTAEGGGEIDLDTRVLPDSLGVARIAAGAGVHAVDAILAGEDDTAFVLGRPPGHHATGSRSMGFCLLNTVAIAATHALASGLERVAILDWDVHHGNGTQDIFAARSDVFYCSIHQYGNIFPGTGAASERGTGPGTGYTLNIPLNPGSSGHAIISALETTAIPAVHAFRPDLILVSAGYDAHEDDPLGGLQATDEDFRQIARLMRSLADATTGGRLIAVLEGGYNTTALARCVADTIEIFDTPLL